MTFNLFFLYFSLPFVFSTQYQYITKDGVIRNVTGNYSALKQNNQVIASLIYENNVNVTGWANLELTTYDNVNEDEQSYRAGFLEGFVTGQLIELYFNSQYSEFCNHKKQFCNLLKKFLEINNAFVKKMIEKFGKTDDYWHQISLVYRHLEGMEAGYEMWKIANNKVEKQEFFNEVFMLNIQGELGSLEDLLSADTALDEDHCSALVKPVPDGSDLFVTHNTWAGYDSMLRVIKKYSFAFKTLKNSSEAIAGHSVSFTSYPSVMLSTDDYYVLSSGLVVQETTIDNYNTSLWSNVNPDSCVLEFVRNLVANRLATNGKEWAQIFSKYNSGTYNNQFMIVDYNKFKRGTKVSELENGLLWVIEQMPGFIHSADVTHVLREQGYWASYNVPYFKDIFNISGTAQRVAKYGDYYSFNATARARIFRRDESTVTDIKSLYKLMRYNDYKNDPLSRCQLYGRACSPPYSADLAISSRNDLNDPKGKYGIYDWSHRPEGAIDLKITDSSMVWNLEMLAISGPTAQQQPHFQWSKTDFASVRHDGQPDVFNFKPILVKWFPNTYSNVTDFEN